MQITCIRNNHAKKYVYIILTFFACFLINENIYAQLHAYIKKSPTHELCYFELFKFLT